MPRVATGVVAGGKEAGRVIMNIFGPNCRDHTLFSQTLLVNYFRPDKGPCGSAVARFGGDYESLQGAIFIK